MEGSLHRVASIVGSEHVLDYWSSQRKGGLIEYRTICSCFIDITSYAFDRDSRHSRMSDMCELGSAVNSPAKMRPSEESS